MKIYQKEMIESARRLKIADHLAYVTYPLINDPKLLLKIFEEVYASVIGSINSILEYEAFLGNVVLVGNLNSDFNSFIKIGKEYGISYGSVSKIREFTVLYKKHKKSAIEFVRGERVVIMGDNLGTEVLDLFTVKEYLLLAKELMLVLQRRVR